MRKSDPDFLKRICDLYASGYSNSLRQIADKMGVGCATLYMWMRDPEITLDEWMGEQNISFGKAMTMARQVATFVTVSESLEEFVRAGRKVQVFHHGVPSWVADELFARSTPAEQKDLVALGVCWPDGLKRDAQGNRIILTKVELAPSDLIQKFAAATMPKIYGAKLEVTSKDGGATTGVTTIGERRPIPSAFLPFASKKDLEDSAVEMISDGGDPEVFSEPDEALDDLLGPDPVLAPTTDTPAPMFDPEPSPYLEPLPVETVIVNRESLPPNYIPTPQPILQPKAIPAGWRQAWDELQAKQQRNALPDKTNRG